MDDPGHRTPKALAVAGVIFVLVFIAVVARTEAFPIIHQYPTLRPPTGGPPRPPPASVGMGEVPVGSAPNPIFETILQILLAVVVLVIAAAVGFLIVKIIQTVAAQQRPTDDVDADEVETEAIRFAVAEQLRRAAAALDVDGDVNTVIVRCWEGLEQIAADGGATREPTQTAREFTRTVLASVELPPSAIDRLADLYEAALFSGQRLPERARDEAIRCLDDLLAAVHDRQ